MVFAVQSPEGGSARHSHCHCTTCEVDRGMHMKDMDCIGSRWHTLRTPKRGAHASCNCAEAAAGERGHADAAGG